MSRVSCLVPVVMVAMAAPGVGGEGGKASRPRLDLRATPPTAFSPARVQAIGRLVGGEDLDELYCPAVEWSWGDGAVSAREGDWSALQRGHEDGPALLGGPPLPAAG